MIDWTKPVQTRDGKYVRIICRDAKGKQPIVALINDGNGYEEEARFCDDGSYYAMCPSIHTYDLINVPEPKKRIKLRMWVNIYASEKGRFFALDLSESKEECTPKNRGASNRVAIVPVEIDCEEGEGLE